MIRDLRTAPDGAAVDTDVCIVGAGAAGISLALALSDLGVDSVLLESGGPDPEPESQALYEADSTGVSYAAAEGRLRQLGGTTGHWAGTCRPFEPMDLLRRPWIPDSGWPLTLDDLSGYFRGAHELVQLGPVEYDAATWLSRIDSPPDQVPVTDSDLVTEILQFSPPTRFAPTYVSELDARADIDLVLHANAVSVRTDEGGRVVEELTARSLSGVTSRVRARRYVLAGGGIENARLLLTLANGERTGLGNDRDLVGRYFADHLGIRDAATVAPTSVGFGVYSGRHPTGITRASIDGAPPHPEPLDVGFRLRPGDSVLEELKIAGLSASLNMLADGTPGRKDRLVRRFVETVGVDRGVSGGGGLGWFEMGAVIETAPNHESRVTLDDETDALGVPRARVDWRLSDIDLRTLVKGTEAIVHGLGRLGLAHGRVRSFDSLDEIATDDRRAIGNHHMGTTRMADSPERGVVDPDCLVFATTNLYVAGSSLFTTSGASTPTVNLVALALRLADHLAARPYRSPEPGIA